MTPSLSTNNRERGAFRSLPPTHRPEERRSSESGGSSETNTAQYQIRQLVGPCDNGFIGVSLPTIDPNID